MTPIWLSNNRFVWCIESADDDEPGEWYREDKIDGVFTSATSRLIPRGSGRFVLSNWVVI